ncbi:DUF3951 domain-containing protein [Brevibacillus borstelensis]|uniref:DUF3951 domain-containing protein n=1 Tax=Brevibacillus borstelensis TaxID=45462 RepID=UPI0030C150DF
MLAMNVAMIAFTLLILASLGIVGYKAFVRKQSITHSYTPFDYMAGQTNVEFHEEKEEKEEHAGQGDDLDKNDRPFRSRV